MPKIFSDNFVDTLPEEPELACAAICSAVEDFYNHRVRTEGKVSAVRDQHAYLEALALFDVYAKAHPINVDYTIPRLENDSTENSRAIIDFSGRLQRNLEKHIAQHRLSHLRADYSAKIQKTTVYRFDEAERRAIKKRFHEPRLLIGDLDSIEEPQKSRLMGRLGMIHAELEHRLSDLDRIWGRPAHRGRLHVRLTVSSGCLTMVLSTRAVRRRHRLILPSVMDARVRGPVPPGGWRFNRRCCALHRGDG